MSHCTRWVFRPTHLLNGKKKVMWPDVGRKIPTRAGFGDGCSFAKT